MSYIIIPHDVTCDSAVIWICAVDEKVRSQTLSLYFSWNYSSDKGQEFSDKTVEVPVSSWKTWKSRNQFETYDNSANIKYISYQRMLIADLLPRTKYTFRLNIETDRNAQTTYNNYYLNTSLNEDVRKYSTEATVTTLPKSLPSNDEIPFKIMLGSCFYLPNDCDGYVGETYMNIPDEEKPELKILCGDQVYLDNPFHETTFLPRFAVLPKQNLREFFLEKYLATWNQTIPKSTDPSDPKGGFNLLLRNGANYFCSDDHEFWNNAPNFGGVGAILTVFKSQRQWWFREASELFRIFQTPNTWTTFNIDPISFCIADTRINRTAHSLLSKNENAVFMEPDDLYAIGHWIRNLNGPGVLALGQVFARKPRELKDLFNTPGIKNKIKILKNYFGRFFDYDLPDFTQQYAELKRYIAASKHSIVVLTGDVHFGRVSVSTLNPDIDTKFVEIISSPMKVVSGLCNREGFGEYEPAYDVFETNLYSSLLGVSEAETKEAKEHFTTIEFNKQDDDKVKLVVKSWFIPRKSPSSSPKSVIEAEIILK